MLDYIKCTCGYAIGSVYSIYKVLKEERIKAHYPTIKVNRNNINILNSEDVPMDDIFEALHIHKVCCRMKLNNVKDIIDAQYTGVNV